MSQTPVSVPEAVLEVLKEVLLVDEIDQSRDFFALGGNSLGAIMVVGKLAERYAIDLPLDVLFDAPDVQAILRIAEAQHR